jgi:hypothetical protein
VPKLLFPEGGERDLIRSAGVPDEAVEPLLVAIGIGEILFGLAFLVARRAQWLFALSAVGVCVLPLALVGRPETLLAPFNPVALALTMAALALAGLVAEPDAPSARRCIRRPREVRLA